MGSLCIDTGFQTYCNIVIDTMPMFLGTILVALMMGPCGDASPVSELSKGTKQSHLGLLIVSIVFHVAIIGAGVLGLSILLRPLHCTVWRDWSRV
ncbi:MAG: hypothetical protein ACLRZ2_02185 [Veillonella sp.]